MTLLEIDNLTVKYGSTTALDSVNITARKGQITCVLGANGAGKSTLFKTIMGVAPLTSGRIVFQDADIASEPTHRLVRMGITLCPEGRRLFPEMSVAENIRLGAYLEKDQAKIRQRTEFVYDLFPRVRERSKQQAGSLSGGEQQMVAIGRALMSSPKLLLLDEPTLGLAPKLINEVLKTIGNIRDEGITVILVEQNAKQALKVSEYGYVLDTGQLAMSGSATDIMNDPKIQEIYLGGG